jgi:hypothetical protein
VDEDGHILCEKIKHGDREVSPNICRACPVAAINCAHLRATLDHQARLPLTVHYGNGKTEIWDDPAPSLSLAHAACAAKVTPIHSPRDCAGCPLRQPRVTADSWQPLVAASPPAPRRPRGVRAPAPAPVVVAATPAADNRSSRVAEKIIQLQEWLAGHKSTEAKAGPAEPEVQPLALGARPGRVPGEEKRVGWTD